MIKYKSKGRSGLLDREENQAILSKTGNPLEKLSIVIDI
jgi:hypothetical protein